MFILEGILGVLFCAPRCNVLILFSALPLSMISVSLFLPEWA